MRKFPRVLERVDVILDVLEISPALKQQDLEAFFGQLFRRPASADAGADHDRIIRLFGHG